MFGYPPASGSDQHSESEVGVQASEMLFGPWTRNITTDERRARLHSLRMAVILMYRGRTDLIDALTLAEDDAEWLYRARAEPMRLLSLHRRRLLSSYLNLWKHP